MRKLLALVLLLIILTPVALAARVHHVLHFSTRTAASLRAATGSLLATLPSTSSGTLLVAPHSSTGSTLTATGSGAVIATTKTASGSVIAKTTATGAVLVQVYVDFSSQGNQDLYTKVISRLHKDYVDTGKVKLIEMPVTLPQTSRANAFGALATRCAANQDAETMVTELLLSSTNEWLATDNVEFYFNKLAEQHGLNATEFTRCIVTYEKFPGLAKDKAAREALQVPVPSMLINGAYVKSLMNYDSIAALIEKELKR